MTDLEKPQTNLNGKSLMIFVSTQSNFSFKWILIFVFSWIRITRWKSFIRSGVGVILFKCFLGRRAKVNTLGNFWSNGGASCYNPFTTNKMSKIFGFKGARINMPISKGAFKSDVKLSTFSIISISASNHIL